MAEQSAIEWTDATWNPITGCAIVSPGCTNCYAMKLAGTRLRNHPSRAGLTKPSKAGPVWTGEVRLNEQWLDQPLRWKRPRRIFVCAHGDLFAEGVPDEWIDRVFAVMALAHQHTFQVLTKRPERMREYFAAADLLDRIGVAQRMLNPWKRFGLSAYEDVGLDAPWPLWNVWLGVSAEDQRRADERIPLLIKTPARIRFISAEPLLGPLSLAPWHGAIDWVIVGGESGTDARPMHPEWARRLRDRCIASGTPLFFKQWGSWAHMPERAHFKELADEPWRRTISMIDGVRPALMFKIGKKRAGRQLDGREWSQMPEIGQ